MSAALLNRVLSIGSVILWSLLAPLGAVAFDRPGRADGGGDAERNPLSTPVP
jgi:hypothetical protein